LLSEAVSHVAHPAIRNRGTIGGSLAHADPASELPACMVALDATIIVRGPRGERRIPASEFFTSIYETALSPQELLVAVELPVAREDSAYFFHEFARRYGDYAVVGLAAQAIVRGEQFADLRLCFFAVGDRPLLAGVTGKLVDVAITPSILTDAAVALSEELDPQEDQQATPAMRRHLAKVLLSRCVSSLLSRPDLRAGAAA
jgi:carbon-monoxide dehydrogenase medium subunit